MNNLRCKYCQAPLWLEIEEAESYQLTPDGHCIVIDSNFSVSSGHRFNLSCGGGKKIFEEGIDWAFSAEGNIVLLDEKQDEAAPTTIKLMKCVKCGAPLHFEVSKVRDNLVTADGLNLLDEHYSSCMYEIRERLRCNNCGKIYKEGMEWQHDPHGGKIGLRFVPEELNA